MRLSEDVQEAKWRLAGVRVAASPGKPAQRQRCGAVACTIAQGAGTNTSTELTRR